MSVGWVAAGATLVSGVMSANAASDAADTQAAASDRANAVSQQQFASTRADLAPWVTKGSAANDKLAYLLGLGGGTSDDPAYNLLLNNFSGKDVANEPGYQFGLQQGQQAIDRKTLAGGGYYSGAALKEAARYGQDYAGTKYGEAFNRDSANKTRIYNFLTGQSGMGQSAAAGVGNAGSAMAAQVGANTTSMGNAAGAAGIAGSNALSGGVTGAINGYQQQQLVNSLTQQNALQRAITGGNVGFGSSLSRGMTSMSDPAYG